MAANNIRVLKGGKTVQRFRTEANIKLGIEAGDAVKIAGTGTNYVDLCLVGDPERATDMFMGVTKSAATNTASADGVVDVELCLPGTILEIKAHTASNVNTDAKLLGLLNDTVCFERTAATAAGVLSLNEDEGPDPDVHGLMILDGRITDGMMFVTPTHGWVFGA